MIEASGERNLFRLVEALVDGRADPGEHDRLQEILKSDPEARRFYLDYVDLHLALGKLIPGDRGRIGVPEGRDRAMSLPARRPRRRPGWAVLAAASALVAVSIAIASRGGRGPSGAGGGPPEAPSSNPRLAQSSGARFFGGRSLPDGARLSFGEDYALSEGILEVGFAGGATAIIKAPAVFEAAGPARLVMKLGRCSVHAPEGAQGFRVETPTAEVVDLGTRFSVEVSDTGGADVQVVEGAAEVVPDAHGGAKGGPVLMTTGQARRYPIGRGAGAEAIPFDASRYAARLPDRVVAYSASDRGDEGAERLQGLAVQRGGVLREYSPGELIGVDLVHFRAESNDNCITTASGDADPVEGDAGLRHRAALLDRDADLNTGVINPGGSREPLAESPVLGETPGLAVRFHRPVANEAGPDVVFFDLQVIVHPEKGDPFHVSPLQFSPGRKSHTVRSYDIDLASPGARTLADFRLYEFDSAPKTLGELLAGRHNGGSEHRVRAKALAVGIDLSDLGYRPGEAAEGLFFQDAQDDANLIDPVFIAGLPPLGPPVAGSKIH